MLHRSISKFVLATLIAAMALPLAAFGYTSPGKPAGYVNDFANVIPAVGRAALESKLAAFEKQTGDEIAVATVSSLGGDTVENYAVQLFQEWGIGKKGKDNGILILVAPSEREVRIEVGYGLEGTVTDLQSGNIIRTVMTPAFRQGDYAGGISGAVDALIGIIGGSPDAQQYSATQNDGDAQLNINWGSLFVVVILFLNIVGAVLGRTKSWWLGGVLGGLGGVVIGLVWGFIYAGAVAIPALIILGLLFDFIVSRHGPRGPGGRPPFWMGGFGGRGGGSGGFGGFGGGMSGGGGASGRW